MVCRMMLHVGVFLQRLWNILHIKQPRQVVYCYYLLYNVCSGAIFSSAKRLGKYCFANVKLHFFKRAYGYVIVITKEIKT